jgi:signal transduction histidine kinase
MTYVRWFGVLFGFASLTIQSEAPISTDALIRGYALIVILLVGSLFIWGMNNRLHSEADQSRLGVLGFFFDIAVVSGIVFTFAPEDPYITWALLFVLPLEGALRYQLKGALATVAYVAAFFFVQSIQRAALLDTEFDVDTYVFVVCMATLIAAVTGSMANQWRAQSEAFQQQSLQLAEVDELKDRFLAITSHEIRGPLTAIIAGVDTVRKRKDRLTAEQEDRLLEMVYLQGHQLARLVDDLQITSQITSGQLTLHPEWADLQPTVNQALEAAASKRRHHQLEIFIEPLSCNVDASRIGQIVRNLVENAYKYTPDNTRVSVTGRAVSRGMELEVSDLGKGIPADKRDLLFKAFSRIEETSAGQEGVGLGLYVVSQLVNAMKGRIDLSSSEAGTTFIIFVPCETRRSETASRLEVIEGGAEVLGG